MDCDVIIEGVVKLESGQPLVNREVQIILSADYGLGGMDLAFGEPSDDGHQDEQVSAYTDADGVFSVDLGSRVHHATFWIVPPLGFLFSGPPPPLVLCRLPDFPQEYYAITAGEDDFLVINESEGVIPIEGAKLHSITSSHSVRDGDDLKQSVGFINLVFRNGQ